MRENNVRRYNNLMSEINAIYHDIAVRLGVSDSVQIVLYAICENGGRSLQSDIYKQTGISRKTINTAVHKLVKDEIVYLKQGTGRNTIVCLTERGKAFAAEKALPVLKIDHEIFSSWSSDELRLYLELTERYRDMLRAKADTLRRGAT